EVVDDPDGQDGALPEDEAPASHHRRKAVGEALAEGHLFIGQDVDVFADALAKELVGAIEALGDDGQHVDGGVGMGHEEVEELLSIEGEGADLGDSADARGARLAGEHGELAEEAAGPGFVEDQLFAGTALGEELDAALDDDVEVFARVALAEND